MSRRRCAATSGANRSSGVRPIIWCGTCSALRAATSLTCSVRRLRASYSVIASGAASMMRCSEDWASAMRASA